ncbi:MAG: glycosyltransferase family 39 protein [Kastovskya adunca ATA6-11-RM4]|jgi:4-amino-4-deoxy-L-arabinose transferase-like glycosyltransferase|nr:glycosyltransferase family 39 protein [Kastovskya adunca ATA6-11-RM4]
MHKLIATASRITETKWLLLLLLAAVILWSVGLGQLPLRDWDEGYYAILSRDMYRTGNWLYLTYLGRPFLEKPPLMQWLVAFSYQIGGVNEWTTRLPVALLSACGVPLLYLVGREVFSQRLPALFAALVYLTLLPVVRHGRLAMMDGISITFFLVVLLCLLKARHNRLWAFGAGIFLGLIALTKGVLVLLLGAIAAVFLLCNRQLALLKSLAFWGGMLLGAGMAIAWYAAQWHHYGANFLQVHFQVHGFERISQSVHGNTGPPWYYLLELLKYSLPWLLFLPGGLYLAWQKRHTAWGALILVGAIGYLGAVSLMGTKLPWYIMPLYPFFALAVGANLAQIWQHRLRYPLFFATVLGLLAIASLGGAVYFILAEPEIVLIVMSIVLALTFGFAAWQIKQRDRQFIPILFVGLYCAFGLLMVSNSWIWELNEAFPVKPVAALIQTHTAPGDVVYTSFGYGRPSLDFYSDRRVIPADTAQMQQLWASQPYLLLDQSTLTALQLPNPVSLGTAGDFTLVTPQSKANLSPLYPP